MIALAGLLERLEDGMSRRTYRRWSYSERLHLTGRSACSAVYTILLPLAITVIAGCHVQSSKVRLALMMMMNNNTCPQSGSKGEEDDNIHPAHRLTAETF